MCTADKETNDERLNEFWSRYKTPSTNFTCFVDARSRRHHHGDDDNDNDENNDAIVVVQLSPLTPLLPLLLLAPLLLLLVLALTTTAICLASKKGVKSHDRMFLVHVSESESNLAHHGAVDDLGGGGGGGMGGGVAGIYGVANTYTT